MGPLVVGVLLWQAASVFVIAVNAPLTDLVKRAVNDLIHRVNGDVMMPFRPYAEPLWFVLATSLAMIVGSALLAGVGWWLGSWLYSKGRQARHS